LPLLGGRVIPGEWYEILEQKLADQHRVAALARSHNLQPKHTRLRQKPPPLLGGDQQFLTDVWDLVEHLAQARPGDAHQVRSAPRDAGDDHRPARQKINIARKLAWSVRDDMPIVVRR